MNAMELSKGLADLVETAARSVVRLEGRTSASGTVFSDAGHVVAINHTIPRDEVEVGLPDGRKAQGHVVGRDPATDLVLLKVEEKELVPAPWGDLLETRVGEIVVGVYRPGRTARAAFGVVGALGDAWRTRFGGKIDRFLELSLPLQPGFSGGLIMGASQGALALSASGLMRGVPLGIPAATVKRVGEALLAHGRVRRGYLGLGSVPVALPETLRSTQNQATALVVVSVQPDSPASRAGLLLGDVLVGVDGRSVCEPSDLHPSLDEEHVGREILLKVVRAGEVRELPLRVGERSRTS